MSKICHMTSAHTSKDIRIFYKECVTLAERGYEVVLVAPGRSFVEKKVQIKGVGDLDSSRIKRMLFMGKRVYKQALEEDADIYHFHDPELLPYGRKLKKRGKKVIFDSHEDVPRQILAKTWIPLKMRKLISFFYEKYEKNVTRRLDCVVTATEHIEEIFTRSRCNSITVKNYPLLDDIKCMSENYMDRELAICYAGGVTKQRGITTLVKAISKIDVKLYIAGSLDKEYEMELMKLAGWGKVKYIGYLNRSGINDLYNESRIGMVTLKDTPNHRYSLPIKMFEYMAAGIPVIASEFPVWEKIINEEKCGICVDPDDEDAITNAILMLFENEKLAEEMGQNGRKAVCEKYSWENEAQKLLQLYYELI